MEWSRREVLGTVVGSVGAATAASAWQSSAPKPQPKERQRPAQQAAVSGLRSGGAHPPTLRPGVSTLGGISLAVGLGIGSATS